MDLVRAGGVGGERVGYGEAAVIVAVPIYADVFAAGIYNFVEGEFY